MSRIANLFVKFDLNGTGTVNIPGMKTSDTVKYLKQKIIDKEGGQVEGVRLIFGGKQLRDECTLQDYNIHNESTLFAVFRLLGGSGEGLINEKKLKSLGIELVTDNCGIYVHDSCSSDGTKRLRLPSCKGESKCNICINCLKDQYNNSVNIQGRTDIPCPLSSNCNSSIYNTHLLFKVLELEEKEEIEKLNKNSLLRGDMSECPNNACKKFVFKDVNMNRVKCPKCNFGEFCWICKQKWVKSGSFNICGNDSCSLEAEQLAQILNCERKTISGINNVPTIRLCPYCGRFNEHVGRCKHLKCSNTKCKHNFCISCLKAWKCDCRICKDNNSMNTCDLNTICSVARIQS